MNAPADLFTLAELSSRPLILALDAHGIPSRWISWQQACFYYARGMVAWVAGDLSLLIRGGHSRLTGEQSLITANSIIALRGQAHAIMHELRELLLSARQLIDAQRERARIRRRTPLARDERAQHHPHFGDAHYSPSSALSAPPALITYRHHSVTITPPPLLRIAMIAALAQNT